MATKMQKTRRIGFLVEVETPATAERVLRFIREGAWDTEVLNPRTDALEPITVVQIQANVFRPTPRPAARKR